MIAASLLFIILAFTLSASAGFGGSLILVPAMAIIFGPKSGIAIAALLLACNNVGKVIAYSRTIPLRAALSVIILTVLGAAIGAKLLASAPELLVDVVIISTMLATFFTEQKVNWVVRRTTGIVLAFFAGCISGFSGTSGPLKGLALRHLDLTRYYFVGAASAVSLAGDATKSLVFINADLLSANEWKIVYWSIPIIPFAVLTGRHINRRIGEQWFRGLFWAVMFGYAVRLVFI